MSHVHHAIDYIELKVTDLEVSKRFYNRAFGWEFNDYGPRYAGIRGPSTEVGGLAHTEKSVAEGPTAGSPLVILFSADLAASMEAVEAAGGRICTAPFAFPGGRRFHFRDRSGNELGVWSKDS